MTKTPTLQHEQSLWQNGYQYICGLDEVGRGALAGPLVCAAVIFSSQIKLHSEVRDSKLLTPKKRQKLFPILQDQALALAFGQVSPQIVDRHGVVKANQMAMKRAIQNLSIIPDYFLIDAFELDHLPRDRQKGVVRGDQIVYSIAAASILAKVYRDHLMQKLHPKFPHYGWETNVGYGTKKHRQAIQEYGITKYHRKTFIPGKIF